MDIELRSKVDLISENYREIRKSLRWDGKRLNIIEALLYDRTDKEINFKNVKKIREHLKLEHYENNIFTKKFNNIFSLLIDGSKDYKKVYEDTITIYEHLISKGFLENANTAYSSFMLANRFYGQELNSRVIKTIEIKDALKGNDYVCYTMLATTNKSIDIIINEFNFIVDNIKQIGNYSEQMIKGLTFSLILEDKEIDKKVEKAFDIICNIKSELFVLPVDAYPMVGLAAILTKNPMNFSKEIKDVYNIINKKSTFKYFMKKELKLMISLGIVLNMYVEEVKADLIDINVSDEINIYLAIEEWLVFSICC